MSGDWQTDKSIVECNRHMLENQVFTDVTFLVSNSAHFTHQNNAAADDDSSDEDVPPEKRARTQSSSHSDPSVSSSSAPSSSSNPTSSRRSTRNSSKVKSTTEQTHKQPENRTNSKGDGSCVPIVRIEAHKYMLVARSPVFYAMFAGPLAERGEVRVEDVTPEAFKEMLNYIYTEEVKLTIKNVSDMLYTGRKYILPALVTSCLDFIQSQLTAANACVLLDKFLHTTEGDIVKKCSNLIMVHTKDAFESNSASEMEIETLEYILDYKLLTVNEIELFKFMIKWAKSECSTRELECTGENLEEILGKNVLKINYTKLSHTEMADEVVPLQILDKSVERDILICICSAKGIPVPDCISNVDRYKSIDTCFQFDTGRRKKEPFQAKVLQTTSFCTKFKMNTAFVLDQIGLNMSSGRMDKVKDCTVTCKYNDINEPNFVQDVLPDMSMFVVRFTSGLKLNMGESTIELNINLREEKDAEFIGLSDETLGLLTGKDNRHVLGTMQVNNFTIDGNLDPLHSPRLYCELTFQL